MKFSHQGYNFSATVQEDDYPHLEDESHGPIIFGLTRDKRAGYMVLKQEGPRVVYYDFAQAVRQARKENWGAWDALGMDTPGQIAHKAAMADFRHLKRWFNDEWRYVVVTVELLDKEGVPVGIHNTLGGIYDEVGEDLTPAIVEIADDLIASSLKPGQSEVTKTWVLK